MINMRVLAVAAASAIASCSSVLAEETFRIGFIDPPSGPAATAGELGLKTWQFVASEVNANGESTDRKSR